MGCTRHTAAHPTPEISEQVGAGQDEAYHHEDNPLQLEREEGSKQETRPDDREYDEPEPEYLNLGSGELGLVLRLAALEVPLGLAGLSHSVPPPQPGHDAACYVLHCPEV